jgi:hypothetical protein
MSSHQTAFKLAGTCQSQVMAVYQAKIKQQTQFLNLIRAILAEPLVEHALYCVISGKKLLLYTDTEEWATLLRQHRSVILNALADSSLATVDVMQVRIMPASAKQQVSRKVNLPSKNNIELIRNNLETVSDDKLKQALLRLSQTLDKLS